MTSQDPAWSTVSSFYRGLRRLQVWGGWWNDGSERHAPYQIPELSDKPLLHLYGDLIPKEIHNNFQGWYESVLRTPVTYTDIVNYTILLLVDPKEEFFA